ncbi:hypothetical protein FV220_00170 [Methylobacterium sp. WL19]|nr:hypothetical protein FV220_00170 [Methylobacterium sp. WL19]
MLIWGMSKTLHIYRITNLLNGKRYIGWAVHPGRRWARHKNDARKGRQNAIHLAIAKYGAENFSFEVVEIFDGNEAEAKAREVLRIAEEGSLFPGGYNLTKGGDGADDLGRLAAASHAKRRALDVDADRQRRSERTRRANAAMDPTVRSEAAKRMWASRSPEAREAIAAKARAQRAAETVEERSARGRLAHAHRTAAERSEAARRANAGLSSTQRSSAVAAMNAAITGEKRSEISRKGHEAYLAQTTTEQRSETIRRNWERLSSEARADIGARISEKLQAKSPEERAEIGRRRWATRRAKASSNSGFT